MSELIAGEQLKVESYPPRDRGGQHVGTESGIRVTHEPTGIVAIVNIGRSQHRNRALAVEMIEAALTSPNYR